MKNWKRQLRLVIASFVISALAAAGAAFASDAVQAGVTIPAGQATPVITENGHGYTPGNFAVGTIHLDYVHVGTTFPAGDFATFNLNLGMYDSLHGGRDTVYPFWLTLRDNGSPNLTLAPGSSPVNVTGQGWTSTVPVVINIPASVGLDPAMNDDGDVLTSQLQLSAPGPAHVKSVPTIIVHIRLVHPTACLKTYNFISDATLANIVTTTQVNVNRQGSVNSTNPYGSLSDNVLVVNTCDFGQESFDLQIFLDARFSTQPNNNPGNAVFTFATAGEVDPSSLNISAFGTGTPRGQSLCLQNITVPGGTSFLATVHMAINKPMSVSVLTPLAGVFPGFSASLSVAGEACAGAAVVADPNPASAPLSFTIR